MALNPYESPLTAEEPAPFVPTKRPLWLDTVYLLATAGLIVFFGPFVIAIVAVLVSYLLRPLYE